MRSKEDLIVTHFQDMAKYFAEETALLSAKYPYYRKLIKELLTKCDALYMVYDKERKSVSDFTFSKNNKLHITINKILSIARAVNMHNIEKFNLTTKTEVYYHYTDYSRPHETERMQRFKKVIDAAKQIKNPARYAITKKMIADAEVSITNYTKVTNAPAIRKTERAAQAAQCRQLISEINSLIRKQFFPFFENVKNEYYSANNLFINFSKPYRIGRPPKLKIKSRKKILAPLPQEQLYKTA